MRRPLSVAVVLIISGCNQKAEQPAANHLAATENATSTAKVRSPPASLSSLSQALPKADASLQFIGTWAKDKASCASKTWRFTRGKLSEPDGSRCSIYDLRKVPGGYDLAVQCPAKKPDPTDLVKLRFAQSAEAMLVESNAIEPMGLIYCRK